MLPWLLVFAILELFRGLTIHGHFSGMFHDDDDDRSRHDVTFEMPSSWITSSSSCSDGKKPRRNEKIRIAYATTVTGYTQGSVDSEVLMDRAAVLHQSIRQAMARSTRYDYDMVALVHPDAMACVPLLTLLGFTVQVRETPFDLIANQELRIAQGNGCCQEKEYLKLYSYLLLEYPLVVHLDLDTIVLRPMDDVFDVMLLKDDDDARRRHFARTSSMWFQNDTTFMPNQIDFMFTRDYNMVEPPKKQVHQMGVQGGFLLVKPSRDDFDRMLELIRSGGDGYTIEDGWGGKDVGYGGYYGAGTIQGLTSYYYGHVGNFSRAVELNRCYYNNMADNPHFYNTQLRQTLCTTLEPNLTCQDCRITPLEDIFTAHFTVCGKPDWCGIVRPDERPNARLCMELFREWHRIRLSLEMEWMRRFPPYTPELVHIDTTDESMDQRLWSYSHGHCHGGRYLTMKFPDSNNASLIE
jgi:hypothetical protein